MVPLGIVVMILAGILAYGAARERGRLEIYSGGQLIGQEEFTVESSADAIVSSSRTEIRNPGSNGQIVRMETRLTLNSRLVPTRYELRSNVNGRAGDIEGVFTRGEADFEYRVGGKPSKRGLLVGDRYVILDTNVFHHFLFMARLFDLQSRAPSQSLEVVIPQELDKGVLEIRHQGVEKVTVGGRERELHHLTASSGAVQIHLWIDTARNLYKIAVPAKGLEVVRVS